MPVKKKAQARKSGKSNEELLADVERLTAELEAAKKAKSAIRFKVSEKGGVSVYGLGRFPVTLYQEQWQRLLAQKDELLEFIDEHADELTTKE